MKATRNAVLNTLEIKIPFQSIPSRRVMNTDKEQIDIREYQKDSNDATRDNGDGKA